jgi:hypothetical protein
LELPEDISRPSGSGFPTCFRQCDIQEFAGTDYAFRIFVDKLVSSQVLSRLGEETDYGNFKSEVARYQGRTGAAYERALHDVWSVMYRLQEGLKAGSPDRPD